MRTRVLFRDWLQLALIYLDFEPSENLTKIYMSGGKKIQDEFVPRRAPACIENRCLGKNALADWEKELPCFNACGR